MPVIVLETLIHAPIERCFHLATSIDLHMESVSETNEKAVTGVTSGRIKLNDTVTWKAKHFGFNQYLTSKITEFESPIYFVDEMIKGPFKKLHHKHIFKKENNITVMTDIFEFKAPIALLGSIAEKTFLTTYMRRFLMQRNAYIKNIAESNDWKKYLEY